MGDGTREPTKITAASVIQPLQRPCASAIHQVCCTTILLTKQLTCVTASGPCRLTSSTPRHCCNGTNLFCVIAAQHTTAEHGSTQQGVSHSQTLQSVLLPDLSSAWFVPNKLTLKAAMSMASQHC
jgi:hypothetical protein